MVSAKQIGLTVRELRRARKMTQAELAEAISRTTDAISQLERGKNFPTLETLLALSRGLSVKIDDLVSPAIDLRVEEGRQKRLSMAHASLVSLADRELDLAVELLKVLAQQSNR